MSNTKVPSGADYTTIDNFNEMKFLLNDILGGACKEIECDKVLQIDILDHLGSKGCHENTGSEANCAQSCFIDQPNGNPNENHAECITCSGQFKTDRKFFRLEERFTFKLIYGVSKNFHHDD